jgi:hypothetical protein
MEGYTRMQSLTTTSCMMTNRISICASYRTLEVGFLARTSLR